MQKMKKIMIICLIITLLMPILPPISKATVELQVQTPGLTQEQQDYLVAYVKVYLEECYKRNPRPVVYDMDHGGYENHYYQNELPASKLGQSGVSVPRGEPYTNRIRTVCSVYTSAMLHQALGVELISIGILNVAGYSDPSKKGKDRFNAVKDDEPLQPGDIIAYEDWGHSMLYIGCDPVTGKHQIAETCGGSRVIGINDMKGIPEGANGKAITPAQIRIWGGVTSSGGSRYGHISRLKPEVIDPNWTKPEITKIQWPNGDITEWDGETVSTAIDTEGSVFYSGLADQIGALGTVEPIKTMWKTFNDIINYVIGLVTMAMRIPFVGIAATVEGAVSSIVNVISTQPDDSTLTLEKIVYNQVPIFDVNLFNMSEAGGVELEEGNVILALRQNVAAWYYAFRNFVIVALLVVLLYLGIRMAITSIAEEKAQYKRMLVDWVVSFAMVLFIHYFLIAVMKLNDFFIEIFLEQAKTANMAGLYDSMKEIAHDVNFTNGWYGTIMYIALVWFMIKYAWKYIKRLLSAFILIILSPLVSISYAIDKIKDNRSQSLSKWIKEIAFTILIQSVHALIYTVFMVGIVSNITSNDKILEAIGSCVFLVIAVQFMDAAEDIFETIFGFKSSSVLKEVMDSTFEMFAKAKLVMQWGKSYFRGMWKFGKGIGKVTNTSFHWLGKHNTRVGKWVENMEEVERGYQEATKGRMIDDTPTTTNINKIIQVERQKQAMALATEGKLAQTTWTHSKDAVKNMTLAMFGKTNIIENPMAGISHLIAGGVAMKEMARLTKKNLGTNKFSKKTIKQFKRDFKGTFSGLKEMKQKEAIMFEVRDKDIALTKSLLTIYEGEDSLIAKGLREGATPEEAKQARDLMTILNYRLGQAGKAVESKETEKGISNYVMNATREGKNIVFSLESVGQIVNGMEQRNPKLKVDHEQYKSNLVQELKRSILNKATGQVEGIKLGSTLEESLEGVRQKTKPYSKPIQLKDNEQQGQAEEELRGTKQESKPYTDKKQRKDKKQQGQVEDSKIKFGESLGKQLTEAKQEARIYADSMQLKDNERQEEVEKAVDAKLEEFLADENNVNEILEEMGVEDLANLMTRAMNREGSIQRDYDFKFKSEEYEKAIGYAMKEAEPKSIAELGNFATQMEQSVSNEKKVSNFTPVFESNVKQELEQMKKVIRGEVDETTVGVYFTKKRAKELQAVLKQDNISEEQATEVLFTNLKKTEKEKLFAKAISIQTTPQMDAELEKYNKVIEQAIELRESAQELARLYAVPMPNVVAQIREEHPKKA